MKRKTKQAATAAEAEERAIYAYDARAWLEEIQRAAASPAVMEAAGKALQALAADDAGGAVWWALATMDHRHRAEVSQVNNSPFVKRARKVMDGAAKSAAKRKVASSRLQTAIDEYSRLRNARKPGSKDSDYVLRRRAATKAGISERTFSRRLPDYLK